MFENELRYVIEITPFRIYKILKPFILYLKFSTHMKNIHSNVTIFCINAVNMEYYNFFLIQDRNSILT